MRGGIQEFIQGKVTKLQKDTNRCKSQFGNSYKNILASNKRLLYKPNLASPYILPVSFSLKSLQFLYPFQFPHQVLHMKFENENSTQIKW